MSQPFSALSTWRSIGRPQSRWRGFGRADLIRVPSPAASTMADSVMVLFYQRQREQQASYGESSCIRRASASPDSISGSVSTDPQARCPSTRRSTPCTRISTSSAPANTGGAFAASRETTELVEEVREQVGALVGAQGSQVIFGPSATALVFAYTRALARTWSGSERIICTQLDHDSNVTPWVEAAARRGRDGDDAADRPARRHARPRRPRARAAGA